MDFTWEKHLKLSKIVSNTADKNQGTALALMGVGLLLLSNDLLSQERQLIALQATCIEPTDTTGAT